MADNDILVVCEDSKEIQFEWARFRRVFFDERFVKYLGKHPDYSFTLYDNSQVIFVLRSKLRDKRVGFDGLVTRPSELHNVIRRRYVYKKQNQAYEAMESLEKTLQRQLAGKNGDVIMWFTKRYEHSQLKVNARAMVGARETEDARVLRHPELYNQSWSATMPPYAYTELCPVAAFRRRVSVSRKKHTV